MNEHLKMLIENFRCVIKKLLRTYEVHEKLIRLFFIRYRLTTVDICRT